MTDEASRAGSSLVAQRWAKTTKAERVEVAKKLAAARWGKKRRAKKGGTK